MALLNHLFGTGESLPPLALFRSTFGKKINEMARNSEYLGISRISAPGPRTTPNMHGVGRYDRHERSQLIWRLGELGLRMLRSEKDYQRAMAEFCTLAGYASRLSVQASGKSVVDWHVAEASYIFAKLCAHALSIRRIAPSIDGGQAGTSEIWDLSSICVLARCVVDAYCAMYYFAVDIVDDRERTFRRLLWVFHSEEHRLGMLRLIRSKDPRVPALEASIDGLRSELTSNPFYAELDAKRQRMARKGDLALHLANSEIAQRAGVQLDYHKFVYRYLSNYAHAHALSVSQLAAFRAGEPESLQLISGAIRYASAYLALAIRDFANVAPGAPAVPPDVAALVSDWEHVIASPALVGADSDSEVEDGV